MDRWALTCERQFYDRLVDHLCSFRAKIEELLRVQLQLWKSAKDLKTLLVWPCFFAVTLLLYNQILFGDFIWDDLSYIIKNPNVTSGDAFQKIWLSRGIQDFWPLSYSVFRIEWLLFGEHPAGYHIVNFVLHASVCTLLWQCLIYLELPFTFIITLLFCVHPLNVETVAWIFQTKTTLSAAFVLASSLYYLRYDKDRSHRNYRISVIFFVLANLSKISSVFWPFVFWDSNVFATATKRLEM